jgi:hypothetical protein
MMPAWLRFPPPWAFIVLAAMGLIVVAVLVDRCN